MRGSMKSKVKWGAEQRRAIDALEGSGSIFLTGVAGSGKSTVLREYLTDVDAKECPVLASTGAAAILVGGRTFHSFFGLGIGEGGHTATLERAIGNALVRRRIKAAKTIVIDEVSMISGAQLSLAEEIARIHRGKDAPWGGLRVVAVGDFAQLPPIGPSGAARDWAFLHPVWSQTGLETIDLRSSKRQSDEEFLRVLEYVRFGEVNREVKSFLDGRIRAPEKDFRGTRLFARKEDVERINLGELSRLKGDTWTQPTVYEGRAQAVESFKRHAPVPELLQLKVGARVMFRQNDPEGRWVNGTIATVTDLSADSVKVEKYSGREIEVETVEFQVLDAEGKVAVRATNYPLQLAWAVTIHKSQGATLDAMHADIRRLWEPGHAYVALSRVTEPTRLTLEGWDERSIVRDPEVAKFYSVMTTV